MHGTEAAGPHGYLHPTIQHRLVCPSHVNGTNRRTESRALQVYATLTAAVVLAAVGIATNITFHVGGFLSVLLAFGSLIWLAFTPAYPQNLVRIQQLQHNWYTCSLSLPLQCTSGSHSAIYMLHARDL